MITSWNGGISKYHSITPHSKIDSIFSVKSFLTMFPIHQILENPITNWQLRGPAGLIMTDFFHNVILLCSFCNVDVSKRNMTSSIPHSPLGVQWPILFFPLVWLYKYEKSFPGIYHRNCCVWLHKSLFWDYNAAWKLYCIHRFRIGCQSLIWQQQKCKVRESLYHIMVHDQEEEGPQAIEIVASELQC